MVHQTQVIVGKDRDADADLLGRNGDGDRQSVLDDPAVDPEEGVPSRRSRTIPITPTRRAIGSIRRGDQISIQQPPGERNALGFIKFMFPNQHAVYLHDTPSRNLFAADKRAFSHGCVRVEQPFHLAEEILGTDGAWTEEKLRGLIGKGERYINLTSPLPVHLTYFTLAVDERGELKRFDDLYGLDRKVKAALGLNLPNNRSFSPPRFSDDFLILT